ncbi:right-handed parallel beta-helix repeat-containing protein [Nodularia sp. LEGE 06071]|nr:right-handed parallel beta-helix repeat-containing protein [Nodularia sp. LEGE 06071]MCC2693604.1 right-handed parallel beta-helix repeat-containing protein [Nodularia sp. LEGE 04288]
MKSFSFTASLLLPLVLSSSTNFQAPSLFADATPFFNFQQMRSTLTWTTTAPTTYYVSGEGSDTNTGLSTSSPFRTIQQAANLTKPGDTVLIMNGVYTNSDPWGQVILITRSGTPNAWIKFQAYSGHSPKLKHNGWNGILIRDGASYIEINGLEVEGNNNNVTLEYAMSQKSNGNNPLTNGNCIHIDGRQNGHPHHINLLNNKVHGCGGGGIAVVQADYVKVDNNEVFNNAWYSVYANSGISFYQNWNHSQSFGYSISVTNNTVYNNRQYIPWIATGTITDGNGIIIDDGRNTQNGSTLGVYTGKTIVANNVAFKNGGSGIHTFLSDRVDIINNTTYLNNQSPEIQDGQIFANQSSEVKIWNNILYAYPGKKVNSDWNNNNVSYNYNIYANTSAITVLGSQDIIADPQFVNPSIADFRLKPTSPAINTGYSWTGLKTDLLGKSRPSGNRYDRGAYEYQF